MSCISPMQIKSAEGSIKYVPCRHCVGCTIKKIQDLRIYGTAEQTFQALKGRSSSFIRLSYNDANLPVIYNGELKRLGELVQNGKVPTNFDMTLLKTDFQNFMKRVRQDIARKYDQRKIKYMYCGEYGDEGNRPHYHIVLFGVSPLEAKVIIGKQWNFGFIDYKPLESGAIRYISDYMFNDVFGELREQKYTSKGIEPPFLHRSKNIGTHYLKQFEDSGLVKIDGTKKAFPYYYKKKYGVTADKYIKKDELLQYMQESIKKSEEYVIRKRQRAQAVFDARPSSPCCNMEKQKINHLAVKALEETK